MALAVNSSNAGTSSDSSTTITWTHTCAANAFLVVGVSLFESGGNNPSMGTVSYNGVAMTGGPSISSSAISDGQLTRLFYLAAPASGANTVSVTGIFGAGVLKLVSGWSLSFTGALGIGANTGTNAADSSATATFTTQSAASYIVAAGQTNTTGSQGLSTTSGNTLTTIKDGVFLNQANRKWFGIYTPSTAIASTSMTTAPGSGTAIIASLEIKPAPTSLPNKIYQYKQAVKRASFY